MIIVVERSLDRDLRTSVNPVGIHVHARAGQVCGRSRARVVIYQISRMAYYHYNGLQCCIGEISRWLHIHRQEVRCQWVSCVGLEPRHFSGKGVVALSRWHLSRPPNMNNASNVSYMRYRRRLDLSSHGQCIAGHAYLSPPLLFSTSSTSIPTTKVHPFIFPQCKALAF